jgi:hypothetical protein
MNETGAPASTGRARAKVKTRYGVLNTRHVQCYRQRHPRIDFYPSPDVLAIILHHRNAGIDATFAGVLDGLIRLGHQAITITGKEKN